MDLRGFGDSGDQPHGKPGTGPLEPPEEMKKWPGDIDLAFQYLKSRPEVKPDQIGVGGGSCGVDNAVQTAIRHPEVQSLVLLAGPTDLKGRQFLRQSKLPVFFSVADDDQYPPMVDFTQYLYVISASPGKTFAHYQTGHHAAEIFAVHPDLPARIVNWYLITLVKTPGRAPAPANPPEIPARIQAMAKLEQSGGPAELQKTLAASRQKDPKAPFVTEMIMEWFAYEQMQGGNPSQALEILLLNAAAYPDSPNVYDSLGEVYLASGQKDLALKNTRKALELIPSDTTDPPGRRDAIKASAEDRLKKLESAN
jgi:tetratricopeptide (TPR) repeat protein